MSSENQAPKRTGLLELLRQSSGSQFVIPVYQRNYSWTAGREVKQFLSDFDKVLSGEYAKHFMGIMIYLETTLDYSTHELSVIDGQQRLTTIFLTLYAVKDIMRARGMESEIPALDAQYFLAKHWDSKSRKLKLKPQVADDDVYQQIVNDEIKEITNKDSNVYKNFIYIREHLESLLGKYSINDIMLALDKLYIVCIPVSIEDDPQKIFESINATGAKLTASDLIRNFILMPIDSEHQEIYYEKYWKKLEEYLTSDSKKLESFFRMFLAAKNRVLPNKNAVYFEFVNWFNINCSQLTIEGVFKEIVKVAKYYYILYREKITDVPAELRDPINDFRNYLSEMPAPLFLGLFEIYDRPTSEPHITGGQFGEIIRMTTIYLMRRALCGLGTNDISRLYPSLLNDTLSGCKKDFSDIVEVYKRVLVNKNKGNTMEMPDDTKLYESILNANMYNLRLALRTFFDKLELYENPAPIDLSALSIEHLMPQTPTKEWYDALGVDEKEYIRNLHRLGNLTLASKPDNSKMQNKIWEYKNAILSSTSHLKINKELLQKEKWTIIDIDQRTKDLIQKIQILYPYFEASGESINRIPIYLDVSGTFATGYFYEDNGSVEVEEGSMLSLKCENSPSYPEIDDLRQELLDEEIIAERENGLVFIKNHIFYRKVIGSTALSATAGLILYGSRNGWDYWLNESGAKLGSNKPLKRKFT